MFDARTPTAWGEVKAYIEIDFARDITNVVSSAVGVTNGWAPRFRKGYGTIGRAFGRAGDRAFFTNPMPTPNCSTLVAWRRTPGRARAPQVKYTYQGPYGMVLTGGIENPDPRMPAPFGPVDLDAQADATIAACSVTGNTSANLPATTACLPRRVFERAEIVFARIDRHRPDQQPLGPLRFGVLLATTS